MYVSVLDVYGVAAETASAREEDQDSNDDCGDWQRKTDAIQHIDHNAPFSLVGDWFARWRVRRLDAPWRLLQTDASALWWMRAVTRRLPIKTQKRPRQYVDKHLQIYHTISLIIMSYDLLWRPSSLALGRRSTMYN